MYSRCGKLAPVAGWLGFNLHQELGFTDGCNQVDAGRQQELIDAAGQRVATKAEKTCHCFDLQRSVLFFEDLFHLNQNGPNWMVQTCFYRTEWADTYIFANVRPLMTTTVVVGWLLARSPWMATWPGLLKAPLLTTSTMEPKKRGQGQSTWLGHVRPKHCFIMRHHVASGSGLGSGTAPTTATTTGVGC